MPKNVQMTIRDFERMDATLLAKGWRRKTNIEMAKDFARLGLVYAGRQHEHKRELGYEAYRNGLTAVLWSSWLPEDEVMRDHDYGWLLVKEQDVPNYFAKPFLRSAHYVDRILTYADIVLKKIENRPICQCCGRYYRIWRSDAGGRFWICFNRDVHEKPCCLNWDHGLSKQEIFYLNIRREQERLYNKRREAVGKPKHGIARERRKLWIIGRPENRQISMPMVLSKAS